MGIKGFELRDNVGTWNIVEFVSPGLDAIIMNTSGSQGRIKDSMILGSKEQRHLFIEREMKGLRQICGTVKSWQVDIIYLSLSLYFLVGLGRQRASWFFFFSPKVGKSPCLSIFDIHPFRKYLSYYYLLGLSLGARNTVVDETVSYSPYPFLFFS